MYRCLWKIMYIVFVKDYVYLCTCIFVYIHIYIHTYITSSICITYICIRTHTCMTHINIYTHAYAKHYNVYCVYTNIRTQNVTTCFHILSAHTHVYRNVGSIFARKSTHISPKRWFLRTELSLSTRLASWRCTLVILCVYVDMCYVIYIILVYCAWHVRVRDCLLFTCVCLFVIQVCIFFC
jgi:hypothetical protein